MDDLDDEFWCDDGDDETCDHDEYEVDTLTGRAECSYCPYYWWLSEKELACEITRQAEAYEAYVAEVKAEQAAEGGGE